MTDSALRKISHGILKAEDLETEEAAGGPCCEGCT